MVLKSIVVCCLLRCGHAIQIVSSATPEVDSASQLRGAILNANTQVATAKMHGGGTLAQQQIDSALNNDMEGLQSPAVDQVLLNANAIAQQLVPLDNSLCDRNYEGTGIVVTS